MHEFKQRERKSGPSGKGGPVKSCRLAITIALEEAGVAKYESDKRNARSVRKTEKKEAQGKTGQQEREGRSHVSAANKRESTAAMGGVDARKPTARGKKVAAVRARNPDGHPRREFYAKAQRKRIEGRSRIKARLENALAMNSHRPSLKHRGPGALQRLAS